MIRITKEVDYGILVLSCLARLEEGSLTTKAISEETGVSYAMACKVLNILTKQGFLVSHRGTKGGYNLSRKPSEISLGEAISALEGPVALTECSKGECDCQLMETCTLQNHWKMINQAFKRTLEGIKLSAMVESSSQSLIQIIGMEKSHAKH